jgi:hypothetical protein
MIRLASASFSYWPFSLLNSARIVYTPKYGTHQHGRYERVKARFWPWLAAKNREKTQGVASSKAVSH